MGSCAIGGVLASDPIGYGVPIWPFANPVDRAENALLARVEPALRSRQPLPTKDAQVLRTTESYGSVFWTLKLHVDGHERCREVAVGLDFKSRRVPC